MTTEQEQVVSSFRDPAGRVFQVGRRIIRVVDTSGSAPVDFYLNIPSLRPFTAAGAFVDSRPLEIQQEPDLLASTELRDFIASSAEPAVVEHDAVPFPSFPYEWAPEMLYAAASLTLDLCEALLKDGLGLKDATPYNILFRGVQPVFVDVLSIEKRRPTDPIWLPYAQFVRTFLLPLLMARRWQMSLAEIFIGRRDGITPQEVYQRCGMVQRLSPSLLGLVSIPTWLERPKSQSESMYRPHSSSSAEQAKFILRSTFRRLRRNLNRVRPLPARSMWSDYAVCNSYSETDTAEKKQFITSALQQYRPKRVLDVGCNTGIFSVLAAQNGASVVAIDTDQASVGATFRAACKDNLSVLPLVIDFARPTPALGWNNAEQRSFLSRSAGHFDAVFMLAVLHHLLVTERIPLRSIMDLAATLTTDILVIEYVGRNDPMFRQLLRGREALHESFTQEVFEQECRRRFQVLTSKQVQTDRHLYLLRALS